MANEESPQPTGEVEEKGLPMTSSWDPEALAREVAELEKLNASPFFMRMGGYAKRSGPGLLQSTMTLGAGSAAASVIAGSFFGYQLLWVQPIAMFLGIMMFSALSKITLTSGERPYSQFSRELGVKVAFLWALGTVVASVIWHFPQYSLAAGAARDLAEVFTGSAAYFPKTDPATGLTIMNGDTGIAKDFYTIQSWIVSVVIGLGILAINIVATWSYGSNSKGMKIYEWFLRSVIAGVLLSFGYVVISTQVNWTEVYHGFLPTSIPDTPGSWTTILGAIGASVGINMTFLYPYTLLAKGWGKHHTGVAKADLGLSMFLPFVLVTSLVIIAMASTVYIDNKAEFEKSDVYVQYQKDMVEYGQKLSTGEDAGPAPVKPVMPVNKSFKPIKAAGAFANAMGDDIGRIVFDLGFMAMTCAAIGTHMVVCGFTVCEMFGLKYTKKRYRMFTLVPAIGILGVLIDLPLWLPIAASALCLTMLPIAYIAIFLVYNKGNVQKSVFNFFLVGAIILCTVGAAIKLQGSVGKYLMKTFGITSTKAPAEPAAPAPATKPTEGGPESPPAGE